MSVALVTGAAGGIGSAVVERLAERGLDVVAVDRQVCAPSKAVCSLSTDLRRPGQVDSLVERVEREIGPIEVLVNAAGVLRAGAVLEEGLDGLDELLAVNTVAVAHASRAVARVMVPRRQGAVVTVASNAGGVPRAGMAAYGASKAAAIAFTQALGLELAPYGIRCNVVSPGTTRTPMLDRLGPIEAVTAAALTGSLEAFKVGIPLGRVAEPDDIAATVAFLVSPEARHVTMQNLYVDGGAALR